jgi:formate hydrogenlyase subunit 4
MLVAVALEAALLVVVALEAALLTLLEVLEVDKVGGLLGRDLDLLISCKGFCKEDAISMGRQRAAMLAVAAVGLAMLVVVAPVVIPIKTEALEGLHQRQRQHQQSVLDLAKQGRLEVNLSDR